MIESINLIKGKIYLDLAHSESLQVMLKLIDNLLNQNRLIKHEVKIREYIISILVAIYSKFSVKEHSQILIPLFNCLVASQNLGESN